MTKKNFLKNAKTKNAKTKKKQIHKKIRKRNTKKNKKGGWLEPAEKAKCTNKGELDRFIKNSKTYGTAQNINRIQAENLSMFPDDTCFKTATVAAYINDLLASGIGPGSTNFVTPINNTPINAGYLDKLGIKYKKDIIVPKSIKDAFNIVKPDMDYRTQEVKEKEQELMCVLLKSEKLYDFVSNMFFSLIQKTLSLSVVWPGARDWLKKIIDTYYHENTETGVKDKNIILKPGYLCEVGKNDCDAILNIQNKEEFLAYNKSNKISFLQLTGAMYKFQSDPQYIKAVIDSDPDLQAQFMEAIRLFFRVPDTMSYQDYSKIINESYTHWFHPWVYTFLFNKKPNLIHQMKSADDEIYLRKVIQKNTSTKDYTLFTKPIDDVKCKADNFLNYDNQADLKLVAGNTYVTPRDNGVWYNTLRKYNKEMIAGPSGSTVFLYQNVFDISKILPKNEENEIMLLMVVLADYTGLYHSTTEILQVYSEESKFIPKYTLDMNDVDYIRGLMQRVGLS